MFCRCVGFWIVLILLSQVSSLKGHRRILNGTIYYGTKSYMVYIIKTQRAIVEYDAWLCGGVIVSPLFVVTSAACVEDVRHMYVIAGYRRYMNATEIYNDECTKNNKKKIVATCVPKSYEFKYLNLTKWSKLDIALAKVETPYNFNDNSYIRTGCSYTPTFIDINYEKKYEVPGTDGFVLGWGHLSIYRQPDDPIDYNQEFLHDASVLVVPKPVCEAHWPPSMKDIIQQYMICSLGPGKLTSDGQENGAINEHEQKIRDMFCPKQKFVCSRKGCAECGNNNRVRRYFPIDSRNKPVQQSLRKNGFCQNDHGGPLIGWRGSREVLLGVQSAFLVRDNNFCTGPFLYTSTYANRDFLDCIITNGQKILENCTKQTANRRAIITRIISWADHPDGPAANEVRPQRPVFKETAHRDVHKVLSANVPGHLNKETIKIRPQIPLSRG